jgi:DNA polymerase elongation subunit (family B)
VSARDSKDDGNGQHGPRGEGSYATGREYHRYVQLMKEEKVPLEELVFTKRTSKDCGNYIVDTVESSALRHLEAEGRSLRTGEVLQYIITDYYNKRSNRRTTPVELIDDNNNTSYDVKRYTELLASTCNSVTKPFGYTLLIPLH